MPNVMAAMPNIGGALCSTPQSLADTQYRVPCSNAAKTRNPLKLQGCPKLANRLQPLVGRSSPYQENMWRRYRRLTNFFRLSIQCLSCEDTAWQSCTMVQNGDFVDTFKNVYQRSSKVFKPNVPDFGTIQKYMLHRQYSVTFCTCWLVLSRK